MWEYCEKRFQSLSDVAQGGKGFDYKGRGLPDGAKTFDKRRFSRAVRGLALFGRNVPLHGLPEEHWMNVGPEVIQTRRWGLDTGTPQIVMNYAHVGAGPWRIKALIDDKGRPVTSAFLVFRVHDNKWSLYGLWAFLSSPLANAYVYCSSMERQNVAGKRNFRFQIGEGGWQFLGVLRGLLVELSW